MTHAAALPASSGADERSTLERAYSRITWRLIPFLATLWVLAWLDRVNIGYAKLQMLDDLAFSEAVYGLGAGIFFLGYFFFEVPSNLLLEKIGARKTIMRITIGWGLVCIAQMFVKTPGMFYFLRFLLGVFEAGFYPGIILYLTYWYPTTRRARAFGLFMSATALAGVIGGPLAGAIMTGLHGLNGWSGWQWLFLIEGIPSVLAGVVTMFYLTNKPQEAKWLSAEEKRLVLADIERDHGQLGDREHSFLSALRNPKIWLLVLIFFCVIGANSSLTFFAPTLVKQLGFTSTMQIGWIMSAIYLLGAAGMILNGRHSDRKKEARLHCGVAALVGAVGLTVVALVSDNTAVALAALAVAVVGTMSAIPVFWQLPSYFLSGSAAAAGIALINSIANLAGFGAPWMLGVVKTNTGSFTGGLLAVAAIEALTLLIILAVIPRRMNTRA
ncbi:MFS transporter [Thauera sp. 2A1]|uniref:MFS transporter n=1 Tax=Thauera sp. 2A1 TaxID=2570191 RepID=UPI00129212E9|nr:MFS transporter [Thauera sp. 2A1]KAI5914698.1 MFS transporter [Thauera sp. 2A1]